MKLKIIHSVACCDSESGCCDSALPVVVIGAGPVGLAAAAHLKERDIPFFLMEKGSIAANVQSWAHVTLFSPWRYNVDEAAKRLLKQSGWQTPNLEALPTGNDLLKDYLVPLAELLAPDVHEHHKVVAITREGIDRMKSVGRSMQPFIIYSDTPDGLKEMKARAVIDATGTWGHPNPAMSNGLWVSTENALTDRIDYLIPNMMTHEDWYADRRIAVVGGGHSAINSLLSLVELKQRRPGTSVTWIMRKKKVEEAFGGGEDDELEARGGLGNRIAAYVREGQVQVETPFPITGIRYENGIVLASEDRELQPFDRLVVNTGNRPDFSFHRELRFGQDSITEAVPALAPLIDPNEHSCGSVPAHGEKELRQPEKDFYIVGSKSYGRAPTFLMATGYEQVRSVVASLAGDRQAADNVQLSLPETGVCHSGTGGCC